MYFDLSIPVDGFLQQNHQAQTSKKNKNKQPAQALPVVYSPAQIARLEARIDLLSRCTYLISPSLPLDAVICLLKHFRQ